MEETTKKSAESTKCYICSFISLSKNKVYIFEKTSADLAGIIRLSLEIDINKYSEDSKLFVCSAVDEVRKGSKETSRNQTRTSQ